jgi:hypothetical protein
MPHLHHQRVQKHDRIQRFQRRSRAAQDDFALDKAFVLIEDHPGKSEEQIAGFAAEVEWRSGGSACDVQAPPMIYRRRVSA